MQQSKQMPTPSPLCWLNDGADLAMRNTERLWHTQLEGARDLLSCCNEAQPKRQLEAQLDKALHLSCELFVHQVSAMTESMQLFERLISEQHKQWLGKLDQHAAAESLRPAVCVSGSAFDAFSKATRQVANFASNRFSAATLSAYQQARDKISSQ